MRDGTEFLNFLSDFWTSVWADRRYLTTAVGAQVEGLFRLYLQAVRVAAPDVVDTFNLFEEDFWNIFTLRREEALDEDRKTYLLPERYVRAPFLYNKIFNPTLVLQEGVDYVLEVNTLNSTITFASDPFVTYTGLASDGPDGLAIALFAPKVLVDNDDLYTRFGALVNIVQPSGELYRQLIRGALSLYNNGPVLFLMNAGLNLAAGYPVSREFDRVVGIDDDGSVYVIQTAKGLRYEVPLVATLSVRVDTELRPFSTFVEDVALLDYISHPQWWKGGPANTDPDFRAVTYIPEELAPDLDDTLRDDFDVIDHLFETYFKYHTFGFRVNTLAVQNFDALEAFFNLVFELKPTHTSPYVNRLIKATSIVEMPLELDPETDPEGRTTMELGHHIELLKNDEADYATYYRYPPRLRLNLPRHPLRLNSRPQVLAETASDRPVLNSDIELEERLNFSGGTYVLNGNLKLGAAVAAGGIREHIILSTGLELEEFVDAPHERIQVWLEPEDGPVELLFEKVAP
jgi:hypothetical protein